MKYFDSFFQPPGWQEKTFTAPDGVMLRYGWALPPGYRESEIKGTVVITTGYADYLESYYDTVRAYQKRGYAVWAMDWAGQGGSDKRQAGKPAGPARPADAAFDVASHMTHLHAFRHTVMAPVPGKPVIYSSHSMGGQIGLNYFLAYPSDFDAAVLAAPLVDFSLSPPARRVIAAALRSAMQLGLRNTAFTGGRVGIQRQVVETRKGRRSPDDPVRLDLARMFFAMARPVGAEDPSVGLLHSLFESTAALNKKETLEKIDLPVLFGLAEKDFIVNNEALRRAAATLPRARLAVVKDGTHGMWFDAPDAQACWWAEVDRFLDSLMSAPKLANKNNKPPPPSLAA